MLKSSTVWSCVLLGGGAKRERYQGVHREPSAETRAGGLQMSQVLQHQAWPSTPLQVGQKGHGSLTAALAYTNPIPGSQLQCFGAVRKSDCYHKFWLRFIRDIESALPRMQCPSLSTNVVFVRRYCCCYLGRLIHIHFILIYSLFLHT